MRHRNLRIIGSLAALGLVIALGVILFGMNASPPAASPYGVLWTLTSLQVNGQTHPLVPNVAVTLTFQEPSQTITGSSGCNSYQASYQQHNSQIRFQDFASTTVGCLGPEGVQENLYLQALSHAETLLVSANAMTITGAGGTDILRFSSSHH
jgi:heat shock protein HslJ